jgi:hypothetical protein
MRISSVRRGSRRAALLRKLAVLSAASTAMFATPARAEDWIPGIGFFVGGAFGERPGFEWGFEAFATYRVVGSNCFDPNARAGIGPMAQLAIINLHHPRVTAGLQGGGEFSYGGPALTGELGATYRFGDRPGFGIHTGVTAIAALFTLSGRAQWLLQDYAANVGTRFAFEGPDRPAFTFGSSAICMVGRPLRTPIGVARVDASARSAVAPRAGQIDDEAWAAGLEWQSAAQYECASVPAFLQLAVELLAHDAPDVLVEAALSAAEDEMVHARISADLASRYLGSRVWPTLPDVAPRVPLAGRAGLVRLATESWLDGCLGEGMAAERARRASQQATDAGARIAQRLIARDEARHADLAWSVLRWTMRVDADAVRDAVNTLRNAEIDTVEGHHRGIAQYGCLGTSEISEVAERHAARSRRRLAALS